jgi:hypothetical protein
MKSRDYHPRNIPWIFQWSQCPSCCARFLATSRCRCRRSQSLDCREWIEAKWLCVKLGNPYNLMLYCKFPYQNDIMNRIDICCFWLFIQENQLTNMSLMNIQKARSRIGNRWGVCRLIELTYVDQSWRNILNRKWMERICTYIWCNLHKFWVLPGYTARGFTTSENWFLMA